MTCLVEENIIETFPAPRHDAHVGNRHAEGVQRGQPPLSEVYMMAWMNAWPLGAFSEKVSPLSVVVHCDGATKELPRCEVNLT